MQNFQLKVYAAVVSLILPFGPGRADAEDLPSNIRAIFEKRCVECHSAKSTDASAKRKIPNILDVSDLLARGHIIKGDAQRSNLYRQVLTDSMPDGANLSEFTGQTPLLPSQKTEIADWINALSTPVTISTNEFISDAEVLSYIRSDLISITPADERQYFVYFIFSHKYNERSNYNPRLYQAALEKTLNSVSWAPAIARVSVVDPKETIFRLDLRHVRFEWPPYRKKLAQFSSTWKLVSSADPYRKVYATGDEDNIFQLIGALPNDGTPPFTRGDWFISAVSKPPLYHDVLDIPESIISLESALLGNASASVRLEDENLRQFVARAGVGRGSSGVSSQNRLVERHPTMFGAYWRSFDFGDSTDKRKNIFLSPQGPGIAPHEFSPDGGEIIFSLPNGFQAYALVNSQDLRIDRGPTEIVFDKNMAGQGRDPAIVNGISCISCHAKGMQPIEDQVLDFVETSGAFDAQVKSDVGDIHEKGQFKAALQSDASRFAKALEQIEITDLSIQGEPISRVVFEFDESVSFARAAAELGLTENQLELFVKNKPDLVGTVSQLKSGGVPRSQFIGVFSELARSIGQFRVLPARYKSVLDRSGNVQDTQIKISDSANRWRRQNTTALIFCNTRKDHKDIFLATVDNLQDVGTSSGWYKLGAGVCRRLSQFSQVHDLDGEAVQNRVAYYYGEVRGSKEKYSGDVPFCIFADRAFNIKADDQCGTNKGELKVGFQEYKYTTKSNPYFFLH